LTWAKDGSGLAVKRIRGMTLPQDLKGRKGSGFLMWGMFSNARLHRDEVVHRRRERRVARARRRAKRAIRRLRSQFACVLPVVPQPMPPSFDEWVDGLAISMGITLDDAESILRKAARNDLEVGRGLV
jgi:hypothetical protein